MLERLHGLFSRKRKGSDDLTVEAVYPDALSAPLADASGSTRGAELDWAVVTLVCVLLGIGTVMVYSASISLADSPKYGTTPYYFLLKHLMALAASLIAALLVYRVPMRRWRQFAWPLGVIALIGLAAVLIPGIGVSVNGSRRWIRAPFMNLQVSELAKFSTVICVSYFTVRRQDYMHSFRKGFLPLALPLAAAAMLLMKQPDLGAAIVVMLIAIGILFLGGLAMRILLTLIGAVVLMVAAMIFWTPWRLGRFMAYLDPWAEENVLGKAYQLSHSLIAFGRGEIFGAGLGASVEKLNYLPEAHTDFILAVVGEELGFAGVVIILFLYYRLIRSAFEIGRIAIKMDNIFSGLVAQGVGVWIGVQVCINGAVAMGLFPTKGLTLPLMSYGGSALMATLCGIALLLRVDHENRVQMHGG